MADPLDHMCTDEIVCPYCLYQHSDSWERSQDDGEMECSECEREFRYSRYTRVSYTTYPNADTLHGEQPREGGSSGD